VTTTARVNSVEKYSGKSTGFLLIGLCILSIFNDPVSTVDVM
jgi:hypothetical protein